VLCSTAVHHSNPEKDPVLAVISPYSIMGKSDENCGSTISGFDGECVLNSNSGCCFNVTNIDNNYESVYSPSNVSRRKSTSVMLALILVLSGCLSTTEPQIIDIIDTTDDGGESSDNDIDGNSTDDNSTIENETAEVVENNSALGASYLIIHFEPATDAQIDEMWPYLQDFITSADAGNHDLTLAFAHHWASNILANSTRLNDVRTWETNGHELALHHHSRDHPTEWDGYSNSPTPPRPNAYKGNMSALMDLMNQLPIDGKIVTAAGDGRETDWHPELLYSAEAGDKVPADMVSQPETKTYGGNDVMMVTKAGYKVHFTSYDLTLNFIDSELNASTDADIHGFVIQNETFIDYVSELQALFDLLESRGVPLRSLGDILSNYSDEDVEGVDQPVLYLSFTLHVEGWTNEDLNQEKFNRHSNTIQNASDLFASYGAYMNIEVRPDEFIAGAIAWNSTILADLEAEGHTIGIHADIGNAPGTTLQSMTNVLTNMKALGEAQGVSIRGVSGICSDVDWVQAAFDAGYEYITSIVEYCMMSMTNETIPAGYEDVLNCTTPAECHDTAFHAAPEYSMHPYRPDIGADWANINHSSAYPVLIMSGVQEHSFHCLSTNPTGDCAYNNGTIIAYIEAVELALENLDANYLNTMNTVWSLGSDIPVELQHGLFTALQPYIDSGQVELASVGEVYDLYLDWASAQSE